MGGPNGHNLVFRHAAQRLVERFDIPPDQAEHALDELLRSLRRGEYLLAHQTDDYEVVYVPVRGRVVAAAVTRSHHHCLTVLKPGWVRMKVLELADELVRGVVGHRVAHNPHQSNKAKRRKDA